MIQREDYLKELWAWKDDSIIKVVTGIRRCGKSTLLKQYQDLLTEQGVSRDQIISINFEELENEELLDYKKLYAYLTERMDCSKKNYIFLDEIQQVAGYEKVVDSLYVKEYADIYITGSNSYMLSGDLATLLTGRYVEIKVLPFSFREFCSFTELPPERAWSEYMKFGGLPYLAAMNDKETKADLYLEGIYHTVIMKDIEERQRRKERDSEKRNVNDISLLKSIAKFLASVVGSPVSVRSITDYITSSGRKISPNTVDDYVEALTEAFIFYETERYDVVGKELLKFHKKYYIVDLGLRNYMLPRREYDLGFSLENTVYFELIRRGWRVYIGKVGNAEVDFVARKKEDIHYFQVTADMTARETFEREMRPLKQIGDNYEKTILTLDRYTMGNYEGIRVVNVLDWLLQV